MREVYKPPAPTADQPNEEIEDPPSNAVEGVAYRCLSITCSNRYDPYDAARVSNEIEYNLKSVLLTYLELGVDKFTIYQKMEALTAELERRGTVSPLFEIEDLQETNGSNGEEKG